MSQILTLCLKSLDAQLTLGKWMNITNTSYRSMLYGILVLYWESLYFCSYFILNIFIFWNNINYIEKLQEEYEILFLNYLRLSCQLGASWPLTFQHAFSKNKNLLLHKHNATVEIKKYTLMHHCCLIFRSLSVFAECQNFMTCTLKW